MSSKVAIQGILGSYHHQVAQEYFQESIEIIECHSFDMVADNLAQSNCDYGIMAIENSIAGSIIPNYALIDRHGLPIVGEYYINIHHHLMALPDHSLEDIKEIHSHPMAILQCKEFFKHHEQITLVEESDTAGAAKKIADEKITGVAAIASSTAAQIYGLEIINSDIQEVADNMTRFVVLSHGQTSQPKVNKASIRFTTEHKRGSLAAVLNVMSDCHLNLTKIQSLPIIETPWKYFFFVDISFEDHADFEKASSILQIMLKDFKILGEYENGLQEMSK